MVGKKAVCDHLLTRITNNINFIAFVRKHYIPEGGQNNCPAKYPTLLGLKF